MWEFQLIPQQNLLHHPVHIQSSIRIAPSTGDVNTYSNLTNSYCNFYLRIKRRNMSQNLSEPKKTMTDEERLELAQRLDKELDDFINNLPKKKYTDGWPEDRWEEEMEKHPFFMKKPPGPGDDLHPLYEGLQQLKYDPDENSPKELAISYKEDGNFNFKHKNYRLAILSYTEGIKAKCGDPDVEASLLNNRSAANYFLKNYRSSLRDCELALKINPDYTKALARAANCCFHLNQFDKCLQYCDKILEKNGGDEETSRLRRDCVDAKKCAERDSRRKERAEQKKAREDEVLIKEILSRNINIETRGDTLGLEHLRARIPEDPDRTVRLDDDGNLVWPVVFLYPEYRTSDTILCFSENDLFVEHLSVMFETTPEWDSEKKYTVKNVNVYYENARTRKVHPVVVEATLKQILQEKTYLLSGGTPFFMVLSKDSAAEKSFLGKY